MTNFKQFSTQRVLQRLALAVLGVASAGLVHAANVDLQVSQFTDTPDPAVRGGNITYTIKVENNAAATANNVVVTSVLPANTAFVSVSDAAVPGACSEAAGTVTCTYATLAGSAAGGPVRTIAMVLKTTGSTVNTINPSVAVTTSDTDTNPTNNSLTQNTTIDDGADLYATLNGAPDPVQGGANVTWTVDGGNNGPNDASSVRVQITLPSSFTYVSASGGGFSCSTAGSPVVVTCSRSALASGASFAGLNLVTTVSGVSSGNILLGADISSLVVSDPDASNNGPTKSIQVDPGADLRITQGAPSPTPGIEGQNVTFSLNPSNLGSSAATAGLDVTYQLPVGFTFVSSSVSSGSATGWGACTVDGANLVTCSNTGSYASGRSNTLQIVATPPVVGSSTVYNNITATIAPRAGSPSDPVAGNNTAQVNLTVAPNGVDLSLTKTKSPNPVAVGGTITSILAVSNAGPQQAPSGVIEVTDVLDISKETYAGFSGTNWACVFASPNVTCTYNATLNAGVTQSGANRLTILTTAVAAGNATNNATVACITGACPGDWNGANNGPIPATVAVTATANSPDLVLTNTATTVGGTATTLEFNETTLTYTLGLTNQLASPIAAQDVVVTFAIPGFITGTTAAPVVAMVPSFTHGSNATFNCVTSAGGTVTCTQTGGTLLEPGDLLTFSIPVDRAMTAGTYSGAATTASAFSSTQGDPNRADNTALVSVTIDPIADVRMVSKTITSATNVGTQTALAGTNVTYALNFQNSGPDTAQTISVADVFTVGAGDPGFTFISASGSGISCSGLTAGTSYGTGNHTLTCTRASMTNGESRSVDVVIRPNWKTGQVAGVTWDITNTATISTTTPENSAGTDNGNNSQSATLHVDAAQLDALINNTDNVDPLGYDAVTLSNNDITYLSRITNRGASLATGLGFTYTMTPPAGKTVTFRGDGSAAGVAAANPSGTVAGSICNNVGNSVTGPATLTLTCTYTGTSSELAANASVNRYLVFRVGSAPAPNGDTLNTNATVFTNETDSNAANNSEAETTSVRVRADITLTKVPSANPVQLRQPFVWTLTATNNGPGVSQVTSLTDTLPTGMAFFGATPSWTKSSGGSGTCATAGQDLTCNFGVLAASATVTLTVPVRMTAMPVGGTTQNCANVTTSEVDPATANNTTVCNNPVLAVQKSSLAGTVYSDKNNNGAINAGEGGIPAVTVTLTGTDLYGNVVNTPATTAADGTYLFDNLSPADATGYTITETQPAGYGDGLETVGSVAGSSTPANDQFKVVLPGNTTATGYNFGEIGVSLSGKVFVDNVTVNGQLDAGEPGIGGVTMTLSGLTSTGVNVCTVVTCVVTTAADGSWSYPVLPPSDGAGYTVVETQPAAYTDGGDQLGSAGEIGAHVNDRFTVNLSVAGTHGTGYNLGEVAIGGSTASLSGRVWLDKDHDRRYVPGPDDLPQASWTVELLKSGVVVASQLTSASGQYSFPGLVPGSGYQVRFRHPTTGAIWGSAVPNEQGTAYTSGTQGAGNPAGAQNTDGTLNNLTLVAGDNIVEQSLPLDPAGVVYDALSRQPVAGAVVTVSGPGGFNPAIHLVGGIASVTTGADGRYQFLLVPGAPNGTYTLGITTYPAGYVQAPSSLIPVCTNTLTVNTTAVGPNPALVQPLNTAPAVGIASHNPAACPASTTGFPVNNTQYWFSLSITAAAAPFSANLLNNHIPLDPSAANVLVVAKSGSTSTVELGDSLQYTVQVFNRSSGVLNNVRVVDGLPAGFRYIAGTSTLAGTKVADPAGGVGPALTYSIGNLAANSSVLLTYRVRVAVGSQQGTGINRAQAFSGSMASNVAQWKVRVTGGVFTTEACVLGKVFVDCNGNHLQDPEELGVPGVRLYMQDGTYLISDSEGKYSMCNLPPRTHVLTVDKTTLPRGSRLTTSSNRNAGDAGSLFLDLKFGELHRADFIEGSCSNSVLEQVKARRAQGEVAVPQVEKTGGLPLRFDSQPALAPQQATDSANQPAVKPRYPVQTDAPVVPQTDHELNVPVPLLPMNQQPESAGGARVLP